MLKTSRRPFPAGRGTKQNQKGEPRTMKKLMSLALSGLLAAGALAATAFVSGPSAVLPAQKDAFSVAGLKITDASAVTQGVRVWSALADRSKEKFVANEVMYYALELEVKNPIKDVTVNSAVGKEYTVLVSSESADLSVNTMMDVVLSHPHESDLANVVSTANGTTKANATNALSYERDKNTLTFRMKVWNDDASASNVNVGSEHFNLGARETSTAPASNAFTIGFTGINRAAAPGALTAKVSPREHTFKDGVLSVVMNGRTYRIAKTAASWKAASDPASWPQTVAESLSTVGYEIALMANGTDALPIVTLDTEVTNADGYGVSLGLAKDGRMIVKNTFNNAYVYADNAQSAFTAEELSRFDTMMSDFGFSTAHNYKLQDSNFEQATTYEATLTAAYNRKDEEADVDEPTDEKPDDEIDGGVEELPDDEIDEEPGVEEVPKTGDGASHAALALSLGAAGLLALAAGTLLRKREQE